MKYCKNLSTLLLGIFLLLTSCEKEEIKPTDNLNQIGILGQWKLESRAINGISDLSIQCCDYIIFNTDNNLDDLKGTFMASGVGYETNGEFELITSTNLINLDYDNIQKSYKFQISDSLTTFTYIENNEEIVEYWVKEE